MNWKESIHSIYMKSVAQPLTIVEACRLLFEMKEDRKFSIISAMAESKRAQAKVVGAKRSIDNPEDLQEFHLRAQSYLIETSARSMLAQTCLDMARIELAYIEYLLDTLTAQSEFDVGVTAWQLVQEIESAYELVWAALTTPLQGDAMRSFASHERTVQMYKVVKHFEDKMVTRPEVIEQFRQMWPEIGTLYGFSDSSPKFHETLTPFFDSERVRKLTQDYQKLSFLKQSEEAIIDDSLKVARRLM